VNLRDEGLAAVSERSLLPQRRERAVVRAQLRPQVAKRIANSLIGFLRNQVGNPNLDLPEQTAIYIGRMSSHLTGEFSS
jgi:hypothetical protein